MTKNIEKKIGTLINEMIEAGIVWAGDRDTAISRLASGKSWSTGIKDDKTHCAEAIAIAAAHGFESEVDDSASSVDFIIRPLA